MSWIEYADEQDSRGLKQKQCEVCKHWFYPEEF